MTSRPIQKPRLFFCTDSRSTSLDVAEAGTLKLDLRALKCRNPMFFFSQNAFLHIVEIPNYKNPVGRIDTVHDERKTRCSWKKTGQHARKKKNLKKGKTLKHHKVSKQQKCLWRKGKSRITQGVNLGGKASGKGRMNGTVRNARGNARSHGEKDKRAFHTHLFPNTKQPRTN